MEHTQVHLHQHFLSEGHSGFEADCVFDAD